jgi:hypothetical protein
MLEFWLLLWAFFFFIGTIPFSVFASVYHCLCSLYGFFCCPVWFIMNICVWPVYCIHTCFLSWQVLYLRGSWPGMDLQTGEYNIILLTHSDCVTILTGVLCILTKMCRCCRLLLCDSSYINVWIDGMNKQMKWNEILFTNAITLPTSGGHSVGVVRSRIQTMELVNSFVNMLGETPERSL